LAVQLVVQLLRLVNKVSIRKRGAQVVFKQSGSPSVMNRDIMTNKRYFYGLQPRWLGGDRLYQIFITSRAFCGAQVGGQFYDEQSSRFLLKQLGILAIILDTPIINWVRHKREESKRIYDAIDPMSPSFLNENKNNFHIFREEVHRIVIDNGRSWWTGGAPNSGIIKFALVNGKSKKFILIGNQDLWQIESSLLQFGYKYSYVL
jgi:hypothetical protein